MTQANPRCDRTIRRPIVLVIALAAATVPAARSFAYYGVQTNVPASSLSGWSLCYSDTYDNGSTSLADILAACDGPNLLLGCRPVGSPTISVLAHAPRADVIFDTGSGNTPHDANGVGWYYSDSWSWGFAPQGEPINRYSCDTESTGADDRLCWHSSGGFINGGWRCGSAVWLNSDSGWERLVYEGSLSCGDGVIDAGEECDDNNLVSGDGCSNGCQIEDCYGCSGAPSTCFALPDGSTCDDHLFCNGGDTCASATCTTHDGDPCSGGGECADTCNEATNSCDDAPYTPCADDGEACTDDYCDGAGSCTHPDSYYTYCDDGLFCNGGDLCYGGSCSYHYGSPCYLECNQTCDEDADACTPDASGTSCSDDGEVCTSDACDGAGACAHPPLPDTAPCPADDNQCTSDHCDGAGACAHPAVTDGTGCDDDNACTQTDQCESGACVGSNAIVCTAAACIAPGTCDPDTGTCGSCPPGYAQGGGGCQRTYAIDAGLLDGVYYSCTPTDPYTDCTGTPFGFHWTDTGDASVGAVIGIDLAFNGGVDCSAVDHTVTLNGDDVGTLAPQPVCYCAPDLTPETLAGVDPSSYTKGGANAVSISAADCFGLSDGGAGAYAVVTVTYADPGPQPAVATGCRTALQSKLKYKNSSNDAKDKLGWKWIKGAATTGTEFANPTSSADYQLCVFRQSSGTPALLFASDVPASASRWSASGSNYKYNDPAAAQDGMSKILLKSGAADKAKIVLKGKAAGLADPALPLAPGTTGVLVQLKNESNGLCWQSTFPIASVQQSASGLKASAP